MLSTHHIAVLGLGYVGLPVAVNLANQFPVTGFDKNKKRIEELKSGIDLTGEVKSQRLTHSNLTYTDSAADLAAADVFIVAVPTPIDSNNQPDLNLLKLASETTGSVLKRGNIVIFESTVYPGATEEVCVPILEATSGLKLGKDFSVGYSPERINPGDKDHRFDNTAKLVAANTPEAAQTIAAIYASVIQAEIHLVSNIKTAEAAKIIENTQRDLNIALINEMAKICHRLDIDTHEVLESAGTKWNFLPFKPGLVGGHCIGVDPYYLTHKAQQLNYHPEVILAGRRINDSMGHYIADQITRILIQANLTVKGARAAVLGLTFKENCPDLRNSKVFDLINALQSYDMSLQVHDPLVDPSEAEESFGISIAKWEDIKDLDIVIVAVAHQFYQTLAPSDLASLFRQKGLVVDIKGVCDKQLIENEKLLCWRL